MRILEKITEKLPFIILFLIIIISVYPFFEIGFTSNDEIEFYVQQHLGSKWQSACVYAQSTGRFSFYLTYPIYCIIFWTNTLFVPKLLNTILLVLNFFFAGLIFNKLSGAKSIHWIFLLLGITTLQITPVNSPVVSYPTFFTFSFLLVEFATLFIIKGIADYRKIYIWFGSFLLLITFVYYETYLVYALIICLGIIIHHIQIHRIKLIGNLIKNVMPVVTAVTVYLITYWSFRHFYPSQYDGSMIKEGLTLSDFFGCMYSYSTGAYPLKSFFSFLSILKQKSLIADQSTHFLTFFLQNLQLATILKSILLFFTILFFANRIKMESFKNTILLLILIVPLFLLPNMFIALANKYQLYYTYGAWFYITTYFSHFGTVLLFIIAFYVPIIFFKKRVIAFQIYYLVLALLFSILSIFTETGNRIIADDMKQVDLKFKIIDGFLKSDEVKQLPENTQIYAPTLHRSNSITNSVNPDISFMRYYSYTITNKTLHFETDISKSKLQERTDTLPQYTLFYNQALKTDDQFFAFSKIDRKKLCEQDSVTHIYASNAVIYYYSPYKTFSLYIPCKNENDSILINSEIHPIEKNWFHIKNKKVGGMSKIVFEADSIALDEITISNIIPFGANIINIDSNQKL